MGKNAKLYMRLLCSKYSLQVVTDTYATFKMKKEKQVLDANMFHFLLIILYYIETFVTLISSFCEIGSNAVILILRLLFFKF